MDDRLTISAAEAARITGLSLRTIRKMIASGELPSYKLGRRRLISRRVLADVIACSTDAALTKR